MSTMGHRLSGLCRLDAEAFAAAAAVAFIGVAEFEAFLQALALANDVGKPDIGQIMGRAIGAKIYDDKKEIAQVAKKIGREITKTRYIGKINENQILTDAIDYIKEECGNEVIIHNDDSYDPENKAKNAMPYKPAIFME